MGRAAAFAAVDKRVESILCGANDKLSKKRPPPQADAEAWCKRYRQCDSIFLLESLPIPKHIQHTVTCARHSRIVEVAIGVFNSRVQPVVQADTISRDSLSLFVRTVLACYGDQVPYHNSLHAMNVTQNCCRVLSRIPTCSGSALHMLSGFVAALTHDAGHAGITNGQWLQDLGITLEAGEHVSMFEEVSIKILQRLFASDHKACFITDTYLRERVLAQVIEAIRCTDLGHSTLQDAVEAQSDRLLQHRVSSEGAFLVSRALAVADLATALERPFVSVALMQRFFFECRSMQQSLTTREFRDKQISFNSTFQKPTYTLMEQLLQPPLITLTSDHCGRMFRALSLQLPNHLSTFALHVPDHTECPSHSEFPGGTSCVLWMPHDVSDATVQLLMDSLLHKHFPKSRECHTRVSPPHTMAPALVREIVSDGASELCTFRLLRFGLHHGTWDEDIGRRHTTWMAESAPRVVALPSAPERDFVFDVFTYG